VTLTRLVLAWLLVAVWFVIASLAIPVVLAALARPADAPAAFDFPRPPLKWRLVEAALLTLLASLWFDSLGSGGWWVLFLLVGALATGPLWLRSGMEPLPLQALVVGVCADLLRYLAAGAILAWRLE
jgi:hypothetical protein